MENKIKNWWDNLNVEVRDAINHSLFNKQIFDLEKAYKVFGHVLK